MKRAGRIILGIAAIGVLCGIGAGAFLAANGDESAEDQPVGHGAARVPVVVTPAKKMTFESRVVVSGNVQAKNYALVSARIPGSLDRVFVDEGDSVKAGETQLFQTDSVKLAKAVAVARQQLTVAECTVQEKKASFEQTVAQNEQAIKDLERYRELAEKKAVPTQLYEQQGSQAKQTEAMVKHKQALIALAEAQLEQARLSLTMAEKDLQDSLVLAPINGRVSSRMREPGEMAAPGTPIVKIEDLSVLEISVYMPEVFYGRVKPGETEMRIDVSGTDLGSHPVTYKSPTVHSKLRTFEVQAVVENPTESVVPGCLAEVSLVLDGRTGVGVPTAAIQRRSGKQVIFVVDGETARMVPVEPGRQSEGWTEVVTEDLAEGASVVSMGQTLVEDGTAVTVVEEDAE